MPGRARGWCRLARRGCSARATRECSTCKHLEEPRERAAASPGRPVPGTRAAPAPGRGAAAGSPALPASRARCAPKAGRRPRRAACRRSAGPRLPPGRATARLALPTAIRRARGPSCRTPERRPSAGALVLPNGPVASRRDRRRPATRRLPSNGALTWPAGAGPPFRALDPRAPLAAWSARAAPRWVAPSAREGRRDILTGSAALLAGVGVGAAWVARAGRQLPSWTIPRRCLPFPGDG